MRVPGDGVGSDMRGLTTTVVGCVVIGVVAGCVVLVVDVLVVVVAVVVVVDCILGPLTLLDSK